MGHSFSALGFCIAAGRFTTETRRRGGVSGFSGRLRVSLLMVATLLALSTLARGAAAEENWPAWRGPLGIGVGPVADPPITWSEQQNIKWKVKIPGSGTATPLVWDSFVFVQTAIPTGKQGKPAAALAAAPAGPSGRGGRGGSGGRGGMSTQPTEVYQFVLMCLDRQTGKTLWQRICTEQVPHEGHHRADGTYASNSPVTDGKHIIAYFGSRGMYCFDMKGNPQWDKDFGDMRIVMSFGEGSSPALSGDIVVVNWDHEGECFTIALDKNTGRELWKMPRQERSSWATPLIVEQDGKKQAVVAATNKIRSYDLETGKIVWECGGLTRNVIPTPVVGDGILYATSGYQGNALLAIRLGKTGDLTGTDAIVWKVGRNTPYVPSPLLYDGRIYVFSGNNAVLSSYEAKTGKPLISAQSIEGLEGIYASPVAAGGRIYFVGRNGTTAVIKASDRLETLATNRLDERIDASPALAGKDLLLRGKQSLYCIQQ